MTDLSPSLRRDWTLEELRVLTAIYFAQDFSVGDDARDECRALGDCFGRTPSSIDRQWRNLDAIYHGKKNFNVGKLVKQALEDYLANPNGVRQVALATCERMEWPVSDLILGNEQSLERVAPESSEMDEVKKEFFFLLDHVQYKVFSSGSQGYYVQGKLKLLSGKRFQAQSTVTLIGSKNNLTVSVLATRDEMLEALSLKLNELKPKVFRTGRVGYYGNFKLQLGSEKFQVAFMAVEIQG